MSLRKATRIPAVIVIFLLSLTFLMFPSSPPAERALAGDYHAQYHSQGGVRINWVGQDGNYWFRYVNSGGSTWWAWGPPPIRLGIAPGWPYNAMGEYQHESWRQYSGDMNRMTAVDNEPVYSWQVGLFQFYFHIPNTTEGGRYTHAGVKRGYVRPVADGEVWMEDYGAYVHAIGAVKFPDGAPPTWDYWTWDLSGGRHIYIGLCPGVPADFYNTIFGAAWPWVAQAGFPYEGAGWVCARDVTVHQNPDLGPNVYAVTYRPEGSTSIILNGWYEADFRSGAIDLYAVMMHEYGHGVGMDHNTVNNGGPPTNQRSVVHYDYSVFAGLRDLSEYEVAFVQWQYWGGG